MSYTICQGNLEYNGTTIQLKSQDSRVIRVHLEESNEISLPVLCKLLGMRMPPQDKDLISLFKDAYSFVARLNKEEKSSPKLEHLTVDTMKNFFSDKETLNTTLTVESELLKFNPITVEGRTIASVAKQMLNSNSQLHHLRHDSKSSHELESIIVQLAEVNGYKLNKDRNRFGIIKCKGQRIASPPKELMDFIWIKQKDNLLKVGKFDSAVNILINSCSEIKDMDRITKLNTATVIIDYFLDTGLLS